MLSTVDCAEDLLVTVRISFLENISAIIMTPKDASLRCLYLGLSLLSTVQALNLGSFGGQAETKLLLESVAGMETTPQAREMLLRAINNQPDYTCTATKPCNLGCCGPL